MQVPLIIPPKFVWFQNSQSGNALVWLLGVFILVLAIFLISWFAARSRKAKEKEMEEIAISQVNSPISGAIPQTGMDITAPGEERVVANQVVSIPPDEIAQEVEMRQVGDDLTRIEGIGPALQEILHDAGIFTYEKLAQSDAVLLKHMLMDADLEYIDPTTWPEQARLASLQRWDELDVLKQQIRNTPVE